jgi:hypothetical protein
MSRCVVDRFSEVKVGWVRRRSRCCRSGSECRSFRLGVWLSSGVKRLETPRCIKSNSEMPGERRSERGGFGFGVDLISRVVN